MPVKNAENTIEQAIKSILSQSYTDFEFIIVNNQSDDNTETIIRSFSDLRIVHLQQPKPGLARTLNFALEHANGELVARMDADDVSYINRFEQQVKYLDEHPEIGVVSCLVKHQHDGFDQLGYALHVEFINSLVTPQQHYINRFAEAPVAHPSVMFRKNLISRYGGYRDFAGPEDYELWLKWLQQGVQFAKVPQTLLTWQDSAHRLSRISGNYHREKFFMLKAQYFAFWWKNKSSPTNLWVWGYGPTVFKRSAMLENRGIRVHGFIDVKNRPCSTRKVLSYKDYHRSLGFVLVYVSDRAGKMKINRYLERIGCVAGQDFYFMT
jgi:glycosyltransferase involved in cell wall biosynthesis